MNFLTPRVLEPGRTHTCRKGHCRTRALAGSKTSVLLFRACAINIMNIISSFAWISQFTLLGRHQVGRFMGGHSPRLAAWAARKPVKVNAFSVALKLIS